MNDTFQKFFLFLITGQLLFSSQEPTTKALEEILQKNASWTICAHVFFLGNKSVQVQFPSHEQATLYPICSEEEANNILKQFPDIQHAAPAFPECFKDILTGKNDDEIFRNTPTSLNIKAANRTGPGTVYATHFKNNR